MRFGISFKINLIVLLVVLSLGTAMGIFFISGQQKTLHDSLERRIQLIGLGLSKTLESAVARNDMESVDRILQSFTLDAEINYIIIKSLDGEILAARWTGQTKGAVQEHSFPLHNIPSRTGSAGQARLFGITEGSSKGNVIGNLAVGVDLSILQSARNAMIRRTAFFVILGSFIALLLGTCSVHLILKSSIEPLLGKIREIGEGDLSSHIVSISNDEIGDIGIAFNSMADRLSRTLVSKQELESTVMQRTSDLREALDLQLRARKALAEQEAHVRLLLNSTAEAIFGVDTHGNCTFCNPAGMRMLGHESVEDAVGKNIHELIHHSRADGSPYPADDCPIFRAFKTGEGFHAQDEVLWKADGSGFHAECWSHPIFQENRIVGAVVTFIDITERKKAQEDLLEVSQRLGLATAAGQLGIWDWDIAKDVLVWNDRMFELYGVSRDSFKESRRAWENCLHPDDLAMAKEATQAAFSGEKKYELEFRVVHPDKSIKFIKSDALVIRNKEGKAIRMTGMNQDITEHRHLEEQLRQSQKMEAIGLLAGGVAHDFNNILTAIYGYCSILRMNVGEDSPFIAEIDLIHTAAERAANLTRSLLAFSRRQIISPKVVNLNDVIMNVWQLITRIIGEDIQLKMSCAEQPLKIIADTGQIEQVLMNLAANARDAMPKGGFLTIETKDREIDEHFIHAHGFGMPGKYAAISVSDTGTGMDSETSKKIFEPFFTSKEVGKGTGLGLSIVYGVIKQHNGYINVYSEPDHGTTFRIYLPLVSEDIGSEKVTSPDFPQMGTETVLVAEDDPDIRHIVDLILRQFGYEVILADDGADAVEKFKANSEKIAVIIMDMVMPGKSGREACEEIRKIRSDINILFMSGYSPDILKNKGFLDTGEEVIIKPLQPLDLVRRVRACLDDARIAQKAGQSLT